MNAQLKTLLRRCSYSCKEPYGCRSELNRSTLGHLVANECDGSAQQKDKNIQQIRCQSVELTFCVQHALDPMVSHVDAASANFLSRVMNHEVKFNL